MKIAIALHALSHVFFKQKNEKHITFKMEGKRLRVLPFNPPIQSMIEGEGYREPKLEMVEEPCLIVYSAKQCLVCNTIYNLKAIHCEE